MEKITAICKPKKRVNCRINKFYSFFFETMVNFTFSETFLSWRVCLHFSTFPFFMLVLFTQKSCFWIQKAFNRVLSDRFRFTWNFGSRRFGWKETKRNWKPELNSQPKSFVMPKRPNPEFNEPALLLFYFICLFINDNHFH